MSVILESNIGSALFVKWDGIILFPVNHNDTTQSWASVSPDIWNKIDRAFL